MPLDNRSPSLLTSHGNHGSKTDNSSLPLYRKFRFRQASDFDWEHRDAQNRHRFFIMQAYWDKKAECLQRKMYLLVKRYINSLGVGYLTLELIEIARLVHVLLEFELITLLYIFSRSQILFLGVTTMH